MNTQDNQRPEHDNEKNPEQIKEGLDKWNERLDNNLEDENAGDIQADENARKYSETMDNNDHKDELLTPSSPRGPKDGLDNTGTQGYDSLTDDSYTGSSKKEHDKTDESGTGSSSSDFDDPKQIRS